MSRLTVHSMPSEDCWKDMVRIPREYRADIAGKKIRKAEICKVTIGNKSKLLAVRACPDKDARILLDSPTRVEFDLREGSAYEVEIRRVGWLGYWRWAWNAADPAYRVPAQISLISLLLGFIGLFLGALTLWPFISSLLRSK